MSVRNALLSAAVVAGALVAGPAVSQDYHQNPTYGVQTLRSGFRPDPARVNVQSGGNIDATRLGGDCKGMIASAPDVRLNFTAGSNGLPLIISAASQADTTLVINGPDGRWYCNDDGPNGTNPSVRWATPASGQYDIWIGTYGSTQLRPATLAISELTSQ